MMKTRMAAAIGLLLAQFVQALAELLDVDVRSLRLTQPDPDTGDQSLAGLVAVETHGLAGLRVPALDAVRAAR